MVVVHGAATAALASRLDDSLTSSRLEMCEDVVSVFVCDDVCVIVYGQAID